MFHLGRGGTRNSNNIHKGENVWSLKDVASRFQNWANKEFGLSDEQSEALTKIVGSVGAGAVLNQATGNPAGKAIKKMWNSTKTKDSMPNESSDIGKTTTNNNHYGKTDNTVSKQKAHNPPPNSDTDSITENQRKRKLSKPGTVTEIIEPDIKGLSKSDMLNSDTLSQPGTVGEKNWFEKRIGAFGDAMDGKGSWKTKIGLGASALILGEASATAGQLMNAIDPTSYLMGSEMSPMADLDYAMKHGGIPQNNVGTAPMSYGIPTAQALAPNVAPNPTAATIMPQQDPSTTVTQATGNYENTQMMAQAISAQQPTKDPQATEATNVAIASTLLDTQQQQRGYARKNEISNNASDTLFRMNHKEMMEFQELTQGLIKKRSR